MDIHEAWERHYASLGEQLAVVDGALSRESMRV